MVEKKCIKNTTVRSILFSLSLSVLGRGELLNPFVIYLTDDISVKIDSVKGINIPNDRQPKIKKAHQLIKQYLIREGAAFYLYASYIYTIITITRQLSSSGFGEYHHHVGTSYRRRTCSLLRNYENAPKEMGHT